MENVLNPSHTLVSCVGCRAMVPDLPERYGPAHQYLGASPGCWHIYGEVNAGMFPSMTVRGLCADTYMVQHPGVPSRQSIQSVARHLLGLYWALEHELPFDKAVKAMSGAPVGQFVWLDPPSSPGPLTVVDVAQETGDAARVEVIRQWAKTTWEAWRPHHQTIHDWASLCFP
ncbi:MAG: hypothetical protein J2P36_05040 [Ktedonobacteraceae bacterium]|nr:hypothetical protein [Ktedonobacteraceae bacterium]